MKAIAFALIASAIFFLGHPATAAGDQANFEIMKATADKVWRLNKTTGEISVCTLAGEQLMCTSSTEAMKPPEMTYEERQVENKRLAKENRAKDMEFFDKALQAIRALFEASIEREN